MFFSLTLHDLFKTSWLDEQLIIIIFQAAKTTSAWLISSGFNMGVMKAVGQAVRQGQSFCWDNNRMAHVLRCIGIAPWGYVKNRRHLESIDGQVTIKNVRHFVVFLCPQL